MNRLRRRTIVALLGCSAVAGTALLLTGGASTQALLTNSTTSGEKVDTVFAQHAQAVDSSDHLVTVGAVSNAASPYYAVSSDSKTLWAADNSGNVVDRFDISNRTNPVLTATIAVSHPLAIALRPGSNELWVTNDQRTTSCATITSKTVQVIDTTAVTTIGSSTSAITHTITLSHSDPESLSFSSDGSVVYVDGACGGAIDGVSASSYSVFGSVTGYAPAGAVLDPSGAWLYFIDETNFSLKARRVSDGTIVTVATCPGTGVTAIASLAVNAANGKVYSGCRGGNNALMVANLGPTDGTTYTPSVTTRSEPTAVEGIACTPDGHWIFWSGGDGSVNTVNLQRGLSTINSFIPGTLGPVVALPDSTGFVSRGSAGNSVGIYLW